MSQLDRTIGIGDRTCGCAAAQIHRNDAAIFSYMLVQILIMGSSFEMHPFLRGHEDIAGCSDDFIPQQDAEVLDQDGQERPPSIVGRKTLGEFLAVTLED